jgi:AcrR family transcriptional regulator
MRLRDDNKRKHITAVAASLFASEPFHKVRLEDVAAAAGVGKGTLYVYFDSKEDLYFSIIYDGFSEMVDRLQGPLSDTGTTAIDRIAVLVTQLVNFAFAHPPMFELMRNQGLCKSESDWDEKRQKLAKLSEQVLLDGNASGELCDSHPQLTAAYIPSLVRAAIMFGPKGLGQQPIIDHIMSMLRGGICTRNN